MNASQPEYQILLVEDDPNFGSVLKDYLELNAFKVTLCRDGMQGWSVYKSANFDLCICDVMMPLKDGFTLAAEIKEYKPDQPLIFLTAKMLKQDMLTGYRTGADDYITKPFDSELLLYKINAILKRGRQKECAPFPDSMKIGSIEFRYPKRLILLEGKEQRLSPTECELLKLFCLHQNEILPREKALLSIWKEDTYFTARSMDVYITKLRKYLSPDKSIEIENLPKSGYILRIT
jgi:two-component system OmpR family response regulator